jgi:hypothetical protein
MGRYLAARAATGRSGVAAIGVAQEYQSVFAATQREGYNGVPWFSFTGLRVRVDQGPQLGRALTGPSFGDRSTVSPP